MSERVEGDGVDDVACGERPDLLLGEEGEGDRVGVVVDDGVAVVLDKLVARAPELRAHLDRQQEGGWNEKGL